MTDTSTAQYIIDLAQKHNITWNKESEIFNLAKKLIELSDDEYVLDDIDELIVELMREKIITSMEGISLISKHNHEVSMN